MTIVPIGWPLDATAKSQYVLFTNIFDVVAKIGDNGGCVKLQLVELIVNCVESTSVSVVWKIIFPDVAVFVELKFEDV